MKALMSLLLLLVVFQGIGQKKKNKVDPRDAQIDTLTQTNALLTKQVDSLSKEMEVYYGLYTVIKEKVMKKDFEPARFDVIVDSVRSSRDSANLLYQAPVAGLRDSVALLSNENKELKAKVDELTLISQDKTKLVAELKDLKSLLDSKVITQMEYDDKKRLVMDRWK
jgi:Tfp pilus assembly protein PilN